MVACEDLLSDRGLAALLGVSEATDLVCVASRGALAKEGARHHGYTGVRGYHPLLAVAAGSGDVLMARLREGRAHTARGAAHFLRETIGRVRAAGASGQLTMRADSGFYAHAVVAVCRKLGVRFSITIRQQPSMRRLIEAIPEAGWTPIEYWLAGGADVAETVHPVQGRAGRRVGAADRAAGDAVHSSRSSRAIATTRTALVDARTRGRPSSPRRDRERDP